MKYLSFYLLSLIILISLSSCQKSEIIVYADKVLMTSSTDCYTFNINIYSNHYDYNANILSNDFKSNLLYIEKDDLYIYHFQIIIINKIFINKIIFIIDNIKYYLDIGNISYLFIPDNINDITASIICKQDMLYLYVMNNTNYLIYIKSISLYVLDTLLDLYTGVVKLTNNDLIYSYIYVDAVYEKVIGVINPDAYYKISGFIKIELINTNLEYLYVHFSN
jgi:hypothetical protein